MRKTIFFVTLLSFAVLAGCNTIQGVGKDLGKVGEKIEKTAK